MTPLTVNIDLTAVGGVIIIIIIMTTKMMMKKKKIPPLSVHHQFHIHESLQVEAERCQS